MAAKTAWKRKTPQVWAKIKTAYLTSYLSVSQICRDFKVSRAAIQARVDKEGWTRTITRAEICRKSAQHNTKHRVVSEVQEGALAMLVDQGMSVHKASQALSISKETAQRIVTKTKNAYDLNGSKLVKKSVIAAKIALSGKKLGGDPVIDQNGQPVLDPDTGQPILKGGVTFKGSDVAKILTHIIDKESPTVKVTVNAQVEFMPIDLDRYRGN